jgi:hypothetical protein
LKRPWPWSIMSEAVVEQPSFGMNGETVGITDPQRIGW